MPIRPGSKDSQGHKLQLTSDGLGIDYDRGAFCYAVVKLVSNRGHPLGFVSDPQSSFERAGPVQNQADGTKGNVKGQIFIQCELPPQYWKKMLIAACTDLLIGCSANEGKLVIEIHPDETEQLAAPERDQASCSVGCQHRSTRHEWNAICKQGSTFPTAGLKMSKPSCPSRGWLREEIPVGRGPVGDLFLP